MLTTAPHLAGVLAEQLSKILTSRLVIKSQLLNASIDIAYTLNEATLAKEKVTNGPYVYKHNRFSIPLDTAEFVIYTA